MAVEVFGERWLGGVRGSKPSHPATAARSQDPRSVPLLPSPSWKETLLVLTRELLTPSSEEAGTSPRSCLSPSSSPARLDGGCSSLVQFAHRFTRCDHFSRLSNTLPVTPYVSTPPGVASRPRLDLPRLLLHKTLDLGAAPPCPIISLSQCVKPFGSWLKS